MQVQGQEHQSAAGLKDGIWQQPMDEGQPGFTPEFNLDELFGRDGGGGAASSIYGPGIWRARMRGESDYGDHRHLATGAK